jgi:hypothetical protein
MKYPEGYVLCAYDGHGGAPDFSGAIYVDLERAEERAARLSGGDCAVEVVCSEHRTNKFPDGSCHYCAMINKL